MTCKANAFRLQDRLAGEGDKDWRDGPGSNHADVLMSLGRKRAMAGMEQRIIISATGRVLVPPEKLARGRKGRTA